jgi:hypothetical protein
MSNLTVPRPFARPLKDQPMHPTPTVASTTPGSSGGSRRRSLATRALTALAAVVTTALTLSTAPAMADDCPNAALRAQNNSTHLPDCRAYEHVNYPFKGGFMPFASSFADDGKLAYEANGNVLGNGLGAASIAGGNEYVAARSASGWSTTAVAPSGPVYNAGGAVATAFVPDLRSSLWVMSRADEPISVGDLYLRRPDGTFTRIGPGVNRETLPPSAPGGSASPPDVGWGGASDDLSHIVFSLSRANTFPGTVPDLQGNLYEYVGTGNERPRLISVDNANQQIRPDSGCQSLLGGSPSAYHAMSTDGRVIFWTLGVCGPAQLFARIDGTTTIAVSASQCTRAPSDPGGPCDVAAPSSFQGANADGTRVYFTTSQQLVNSDTDSTTDLYVCDIPSGTPAPVGLANPCPSLREVSRAVTGANVQGVTRISDDGARVYFVAKGVLAANLDTNDAGAVDGANNLYVWQRDAGHPAGKTTFVAQLGPGDSSLWGPEFDGRMAQSTDDGRYLIFGTYAPLIDHGPQADTDTARDVYRYDADSGALARVSTAADGDGGNVPGSDAQFVSIVYRLVLPTARARRSMTDDGRAIVFSTAEALSPADANDTIDVYLWRDGRVSLISSGGPSEDGLIPQFLLNTWISPSGRDIYLTTTARLTADDVDTIGDIYDARVDGGFDLSAPPSCAGDACQRGRSAPPPALQAGSASLTGQDGSSQTPPSFSVRALTAGQRKRLVSTGKMTLSVTTNAPGTLSATATATIARRPSSVASGKRKVAAAGTVPLSLTLSKKARAALKSAGKLSVKVLVRQDNVASARTVSLKLTRAKPATKKTSRQATSKGGRS